MDIAPLLVCHAALATNTRLRTVALGSGALLVVLLASTIPESSRKP